MKKVIIPVITALFAASIVLVAFLGTLPSSDEDTIYCDHIVANITSKEPIYTVKPIPSFYDYGTKEYEEWAANNASYEITIKNFKYLCDNLGGTLDLNCAAKTIKEGKQITNPKLSYHYTESAKQNRLTFVEGVVTFTEYAKTIKDTQSYELLVQSQDTHGVKMKVDIICKPYNA